MKIFLECLHIKNICTTYISLSDRHGHLLSNLTKSEFCCPSGSKNVLSDQRGLRLRYSDVAINYILIYN